MDSHMNEASIYYQDIMIPVGLNMDDVLYMAARILEQNLESGVTSNEELRQNVQIGLELMEEELSIPSPAVVIGSRQLGIEDGFWDTVAVRITETDFEKQVNTCRMSKTIREKYNMDVAVCSICQEDINSRQHCSILKCEHIYHKKCIKEWLVDRCEQPTCPCCRKDVRSFELVNKQNSLGI